MCADAFDDPKRGLIALVIPALTAYIDEFDRPSTKANPKPSNLFGVGCYLGYVDDWKKLRREWKIELDKKGLDYFHMTDFEWAQSQVIREKELPENNPYRGWKREDFPAFLQRLHRVITRLRRDGLYRFVGSASSVDKVEFDALLPEELRDDPECQSYYIFTVANLMKGIATWCNRNFLHYKYHPIHYIFASGIGEGGNLDNWFKHCWEETGAATHYYRISKSYSRWGYSIADMKQERAIQAVDVCAFEMSKIAVDVQARGGGKIPVEDTRKSMPSLGKIPHFGAVLTGNELQEAFDQIIRQRASLKADAAARLKE